MGKKRTGKKGQKWVYIIGASIILLIAIVLFIVFGNQSKESLEGIYNKEVLFNKGQWGTRYKDLIKVFNQNDISYVEEDHTNLGFKMIILEEIINGDKVNVKYAFFKSLKIEDDRIEFDTFRLAQTIYGFYEPNETVATKYIDYFTELYGEGEIEDYQDEQGETLNNIKWASENAIISIDNFISEGKEYINLSFAITDDIKKNFKQYQK